MPVEHARRIASAARDARRGDPSAAPVELLIVDHGGHSWLYEDETFRRAVAGFLARELDGPLSPAAAADAAAGAAARRLPEAEQPLVGDRAEGSVMAMAGRSAGRET